MIRKPGLQQPGRPCHAIVETVDLFPTLAELCGVDAPKKLDSRSLLLQLTDPGAPTTKPAYGFWTSGQRTVRTDRWRLIANPGKEENALQVELFDYETDPEETRNHAKVHPTVVGDLLASLELAHNPTNATARKLRKN